MKYNSQQLSWLLYDPANAAYALIVRTVFAPLFLGYCARDIYTDSQITSFWSICASAAGIAAGVISVLCGPWADRRCKKRFMVLLATAAGILSTAGFILIPGRIHTEVSKNALDGQGNATGIMDPGQANGYDVNKCARVAIKAIARCKHSKVIGGFDTIMVPFYKYIPWLFRLIARNVSAR